MTLIRKALPLLILVAGLIPIQSLSGQEGEISEGQGSNSSWAEIAADTEELLLWSEDPLQDAGLEPAPLTVWSTSFRIGGGYSSNFLKRGNPVGSRFAQLEGDVFVNTLFAHSALTALVFFEFTDYEEEARTDFETIAFFHGNWSLFRDLWTYGAEVNVFYGDQIYDASILQTGIPVGDNLRQLRPELRLIVDRSLSEKDALGLRLSVRRALFGDSEEDYWRPEVSIEWKRQWLPRLSASSEISVYGEFHDEELARKADGIALVPETSLAIRGASVEEVITWQSTRWPELKSITRLGIALEDETDGAYDSAFRMWGSLSLSWTLKRFKVQAYGRWQEVRYRDRHSDFSDPRPLHQTYQSFRIEAERELIWNTSLKIGVEWIEYNSRSPNEPFSERRAEALLEWSY